MIFTDEDGNKEEYFVLEETKLNNIKYLLVSDADEGAQEANAFIMKDLSDETSDEAVYEMVGDGPELDALADIFAQLLDGEADISG